MKGKFTHIIPRIILCLVAAFIVASCISPVNPGDLFKDKDVQDILNPGGVKIDLETPEDQAPALQWASSPYTTWNTVQKGETIEINYDDTIRIRTLPGDFQSYSWYLGTTSLTEVELGVILVDTSTAHFNIHPTARYMISLIAYKDSVPYSTYFYIVVN